MSSGKLTAVCCRPMLALLLALLLSMGGALAQAADAAVDALAELQRFVSSTRHAEGRFEQQVISASGQRGQQASGAFAFSRPGRFEWRYEQPYAQLLIGDGQRLWSWDEDLAQVVVRPMDEALAASPAAILFGDDDLDTRFELEDLGTADGLHWVGAKPRQADSGFEFLRLGLAQGRLQRMELRDSFGQTTQISFPEFVTMPGFAEQRFHFVPPPGADVLGDAGEH